MEDTTLLNEKNDQAETREEAPTPRGDAPVEASADAPAGASTLMDFETRDRTLRELCESMLAGDIHARAEFDCIMRTPLATTGSVTSDGQVVNSFRYPGALKAKWAQWTGISLVR